MAAYDLLVGIDWATESHQACVATPDGGVVEERTVPHRAEEIQRFIDGLLRRVEGRAERIAVAIEIPRGALVETLLERGLSVYSLNPKQLDRFRDRHTMAGAKDDRLDAFVLMDALRTDLHKFRQVALDHPLVLQIRELSRADDDLQAEMHRLTNRLREQLHRCLPHLLPLAASVGEPWFWALIELVTTRPDGRVSTTRIEKLLRQHRIRRFTAADLQRSLRATPLPIAPGAAEAARSHIALLLPRVRLIHDQRKRCAKDLDRLLVAYEAEDEEDSEQPSELAILRSVPGIGRGVAACLLAEAAGLIRDRQHAALRALAGLAPVTRRSGKSQVVVMRYGCNARLRNAFYHWARASIQHDPASRAYYASLRARGHSHGRSLRSVADRWLRILMAMLKDRTTFDPQHPQRVRTAA